MGPIMLWFFNSGKIQIIIHPVIPGQTSNFTAVIAILFRFYPLIPSFLPAIHYIITSKPLRNLKPYFNDWAIPFNTPMAIMWRYPTIEYNMESGKIYGNCRTQQTGKTTLFHALSGLEKPA